MLTIDCLNRVLPVVADSWEQLRRGDVDRLLDQIHYDDKQSLLVAAGIIATQRPDLQKQIDQSVEWISEERGFVEAAPPQITAIDREIKCGYCTLTGLLNDGSTRKLFSYYVDELSFADSELIGLTEDEAHKLFRSRDVAYLRS